MQGITQDLGRSLAHVHAMPSHAQPRRWVLALLATCLGGATAVNAAVTRVHTIETLRTAISNKVPHIVITEHLMMAEDDPGIENSRPGQGIVIPKEIKSIRVRANTLVIVSSKTPSAALPH